MLILTGFLFALFRYAPSSLRASSQNTQQRRYPSHGLGALGNSLSTARLKSNAPGCIGADASFDGGDKKLHMLSKETAPMAGTKKQPQLEL